MPVGKFGRNGDRTTPVYTGINIANLTNSFLRGDSGNTAIGTIDMNRNIIKNCIRCAVKSRCYNQELYSQKRSTAGGDVYGDIKLNVGSDLARSLGCNDLTAHKFTPLLGSDTNMLSYSLPISQLKVPIKIQTDGGFDILINQLPICNFAQDVILCNQPIDMNLHLIKNMKSQVNKLDAVNKAYVDRIKYKTATGNIPNTVMSDHTFFTFPTAKVFASGKIIICEMWVERLADEWIATSSPIFGTGWPGCHKFSRGPSLMTFSSLVLRRGWTRNFRLDYVELL